MYSRVCISIGLLLLMSKCKSTCLPLECVCVCKFLIRNMYLCKLVLQPVLLLWGSVEVWLALQSVLLLWGSVEVWLRCFDFGFYGVLLGSVGGFL